jgi:hypothetical protein
MKQVSSVRLVAKGNPALEVSVGQVSHLELRLKDRQRDGFPVRIELGQQRPEILLHHDLAIFDGLDDRTGAAVPARAPTRVAPRTIGAVHAGSRTPHQQGSNNTCKSLRTLSGWSMRPCYCCTTPLGHKR